MCFNGGDVNALIPVSTERQHFEEVLQVWVLSIRGPSYACMWHRYSQPAGFLYKQAEAGDAL